MRQSAPVFLSTIVLLGVEQGHDEFEFMGRRSVESMLVIVAIVGVHQLRLCRWRRMRLHSAVRVPVFDHFRSGFC